MSLKPMKSILAASIVLTLSACGSDSDPAPQPEETPTPDPVVTPSPEASPMPTPTPDATPSPEASPMPTPTPDASPSPEASPMPTPTPDATPSPETDIPEVVNLISNIANGNIYSENWADPAALKATIKGEDGSGPVTSTTDGINGNGNWIIFDIEESEDLVYSFKHDGSAARWEIYQGTKETVDSAMVWTIVYENDLDEESRAEGFVATSALANSALDPLKKLRFKFYADPNETVTISELIVGNQLLSDVPVTEQVRVAHESVWADRWTDNGAMQNLVAGTTTAAVTSDASMATQFVVVDLNNKSDLTYSFTYTGALETYAIQHQDELNKQTWHTQDSLWVANIEADAGTFTHKIDGAVPAAAENNGNQKVRFLFKGRVDDEVVQQFTITDISITETVVVEE